VSQQVVTHHVMMKRSEGRHARSKDETPLGRDSGPPLYIKVASQALAGIGG